MSGDNFDVALVIPRHAFFWHYLFEPQGCFHVVRVIPRHAFFLHYLFEPQACFHVVLVIPRHDFFDVIYKALYTYNDIICVQTNKHKTNFYIYRYKI